MGGKRGINTSDLMQNDLLANSRTPKKVSVIIEASSLNLRHLNPLPLHPTRRTCAIFHADDRRGFLSFDGPHNCSTRTPGSVSLAGDRKFPRVATSPRRQASYSPRGSYESSEIKVSIAAVFRGSNPSIHVPNTPICRGTRPKRVYKAR
jgi:hypothetical protein